MRRRQEEPMTRVTISVEAPNYRAVEALAEERECSTALVIREAIRQYLATNPGKVEVTGI